MISSNPANQIPITIVTVVKNGEKTLEEAILSVKEQQYANLEYLIIDGGSTDRTLDIIKKYEEFISEWVSESDRGIYAAMNKGATMVRGKVLGFLNADDRLKPGALHKVSALFLQHPEAGYIYGSIERITHNGIPYAVSHPVSERQLDQKKWQQIPFPHPSLYLKGDLFKELGAFNENYSMNADYDFILKLLESDTKGLKYTDPIVQYRDGGASGGIKVMLERRQLWKDHGVPAVKREVYALRSIAMKCIRSLLPFPLYKRLKQFRKGSVHTYYD